MLESSPPIRVALVDDHPGVLDAFTAALEPFADIDVVTRCASIAGAEELLARTDIAVVLLDIRLPDGNGLELLARTRYRQRPAVIVLSSFEARQYASAAVRYGARGYQLKTAPTGDLVEAIRAAARPVAASPMAALPAA